LELFYILDGHTPVKELDPNKWAYWMATADRGVKLTEQGDVRVSTIFLGLDHGFGRGPPLLFETMAFIGHADAGCERYRSWADAEAGHARWVQQVFKATPILALPS
jgi:hypothetical protein